MNGLQLPILPERLQLFQDQFCISLKDVTMRDGEPRTATSTFTHTAPELLSDRTSRSSSLVLYVHGDRKDVTVHHPA